MKREYFKDFKNSTKMLQFSSVPYTKVFSDFHQVSIGKKSRQSGRNSNNIHRVQVIESMPRADIKILISRKRKCDKKLSQAEINDLKSMLHCQWGVHWQAILRLYWHNWTMKFLLPNDKHWLMISFTTSLKF